MLSEPANQLCGVKLEAHRSWLAPPVPGATPRVVPLEGGRNFRDLGGYVGADGRTVRWGRLFRSGSLADLTANDYAYLAGLGVAAICDFRSSEERSSEPTVWVGHGVPRFHSRDYEMRLTSLLETALNALSPDELRANITQSYGRSAYEHAESYRLLFEELLELDQPVVFHCAAGKDRTGVAAALVLSALGVSRADIVEDYSLTEKIIDLERITLSRPTASGHGALTKLTPEQRAPLFRSDPAYIESALTHIETQEGSVANYLEMRLGLAARDIQRLRDRLLVAD